MVAKRITPQINLEELRELEDEDTVFFADMNGSFNEEFIDRETYESEIYEDHVRWVVPQPYKITQSMYWSGRELPIPMLQTTRDLWFDFGDTNYGREDYGIMYYLLDGFEILDTRKGKRIYVHFLLYPQSEVNEWLKDDREYVVEVRKLRDSGDIRRKLILGKLYSKDNIVDFNKVA